VQLARFCRHKNGNKSLVQTGTKVEHVGLEAAQMRVPDDNDLHIWRTEDLETEPRGEDLDNEELVRDFRE
jgi:hypothetical protein